MHIQVNTDHNIDGQAALIEQVRGAVDGALDRFSSHITRVEVHLSDENADKSGERDKRCMMEVRLEGRQPIAATHHAESMDEAVHGAIHKLSRLVETSWRKHATQGPDAQARDNDRIRHIRQTLHQNDPLSSRVRFDAELGADRRLITRMP